MFCFLVGNSYVCLIKFIKMKYRIIKSMFVGTPRFHVEKRGILGWSKITELKVCIDGVSWEEAIYFQTINDAEKFILEKEGFEETVEKEIIYHKTRENIDISEIILMCGVSLLIGGYGLSFVILALK